MKTERKHLYVVSWCSLFSVWYVQTQNSPLMKSSEGHMHSDQRLLVCGKTSH